MAFQRQIHPTCPVCRKGEMITIASRKSDVSTRRRKECNKCGHRFSTHEVSAEFFAQAKENELILKNVIKAIGIDHQPVPSETIIPCETCVYSMVTGEGCSFSFPEYKTDEAIGCTQYLPR